VCGCISTGLIGYLQSEEMRAIRTQEQIAAEEREAAIEKMHGIYLRGSSTHCGGIAALYDHGLRFKDDANA